MAQSLARGVSVSVFRPLEIPEAREFLAVLEPFLKKLPVNHKFVVEMRNKTWLDGRFADVLREHNVALALTDTSFMPRPWELKQKVDLVTADFAYVRWLGDLKGIEKQTTTWDKTIIDLSMANCYFAKPHGMQHCYIPFFMLLISNALLVLARHTHRPRNMALFNITTASSKVVHCTLHNFHVEGKDLDTAYREFKRVHCDSCPDRKPRPEEWRYTEAERKRIEALNREFVKRLAGTAHGIRYTNED